MTNPDKIASKAINEMLNGKTEQQVVVLHLCASPPLNAYFRHEHTHTHTHARRQKYCFNIGKLPINHHIFVGSVLQGWWRLKTFNVMLLI